MNRSLIACSAMLFVSVPVSAETEQEPQVDEFGRHDLEEVVVRATPLRRSLEEMSQSTTVVSGAALDREVAASIGETLTHVPGLANASFGQNVGRPVIRGLQGQRVGVLANNMTSGDASAVSQDHAVTIEPFLADQIEILRGPTTLLYGSGAIAGVVNVVAHTIPVERSERPFSGRFMVQADTVADQRFGAGRLDFSAGDFAFHANAFYRRSDDYEIPGEAELYPEEEDHEEEHEGGSDGTLENSFLDNQGGTFGASWIGETWHGGLSWAVYDSDYGIPGAGHQHAHEDEGEEHEEGDHEEHEEGAGVTIGMESDRWDALLAGEDPFAGVEQLEFRLAGIDYTHTEFEGDEIGTVFDSETLDARLEVRHSPWDRLGGAFGLQYQDIDFAAAGEEAFVPDSNTKTFAVFWVESLEAGSWTFDAGLRYEDNRVRAAESEEHDGHEGHEHESPQEGPMRRNFTPWSVSLGAIRHLGDTQHLALTLARAERAPTAQELFSYGSHVASQTFEVGNPYLESESNLHAEAAYRVHLDNFDAAVIVYRDSFDDYIYQENTGEEAHELPVRHWSQQDATFTGGELEMTWDLGDGPLGHWSVFAFYDIVRAELADGSRVPLMPPQRFGTGFDWHEGPWSLHAAWVHASSHTRVADHETPTPGYDLLNAELAWLLPTGDQQGVEVFLKGRNLLNEDIRNSTSYLKDQAPQAGRNFVLGLRTRF